MGNESSSETQKDLMDLVLLAEFCKELETNFEQHQLLVAELLEAEKCLEEHKENCDDCRTQSSVKIVIDSHCRVQRFRNQIFRCEFNLLRCFPLEAIMALQAYFKNRILALELWLENMINLNPECLLRQVVLKTGIERNQVMLEYLFHLGRFSRLDHEKGEESCQRKWVPFVRKKI